MDAAAIASVIHETQPSASIEIGSATDQPTLIVGREALIDVCRTLRDHPALRCSFLADVTAVDFWPAEPRFAVVYHLASPERRLRVRLKVRLDSNDAHVLTVSDIWPSAGWLEREVYDLFGIVFDNHPDLRRLLMPDDWDGHPLRKDYPIQIRKAPQVYEPLQMTEQEFRASLIADRRARAAKTPDEGGPAR